MDVKCPMCGEEFPYSEIAKQLSKENRIHNRSLILKIIIEKSPTYTGEVLREYNRRHNPKVEVRTLNYILKDLEENGCITREIVSRGRGGRTSIIHWIEGGRVVVKHGNRKDLDSHVKEIDNAMSRDNSLPPSKKTLRFLVKYCPFCGYEFKIPVGTELGKSIYCPGCKRTFKIEKVER